jgi:hypothetical protein
MANLNACVKLDDGSVRTAKGRLSYASLFKKQLPQDETDQDKARYQTAMVFTDKADLKVLADLVEAAAVKEWGADYKTKFKVKKPFLKVEDFPKMGDLAKQGFITFIRTATKTKPEVVGPDGRTPATEDEAYSGRWAVLTVNAWTYDHKTGGKGVSIGLQNAQLLDHADPLGSGRPAAAGQFTDLSGEVNTTDDIYN